ncbi:MAG: flagellar basal body-associated FliL family protein [bacterium]
MKKKLIFGGIGLLLVLISVGATLAITGALGGGDDAAAAEGAAAAPGAPAAGAPGAAAPIPAVTRYDAAEYYTFSPEFLGNFPGKRRPRHIQIEMSVSTFDPMVIPALEKHMPVLRDRLNTLMNSQDREKLQTPEGKEELRTAALDCIQDVMIERYGNKGIDEVFFNTFVME